MNITKFKYPFLVSILLLLFNSRSSGQTASSNNTLGSTGITSIQSTTASGYKLSIGGATKIFGEGSRGSLGSPTLLINHIPGSTTDGGTYGIYTNDVGQFQIYDAVGSGYPIRFNIALGTGNIGIGTGTINAANKLEIDNTTDNTSGLRFTRLTSSSSTSSLNGKQLSVNSSGDVILTTDALGIVQSPNTILAGPASGSTSVIPTFRSLVALDIPSLDMAKISTGNLPLTRIGNVSQGKLLGRYNASSGTVEEITVGSGLSLNTSTGVLTTSPSVSDYLPLTGGSLTGNLGILYPAGSPPAPLTIGSAGTIRIYNSVNNNYSAISNPGSGGNSDLAFTSGGGEAIRILGSTYVGIGTTSPTEKLDVAGNVKFSGALMPNDNAGTAGQVLTSAGTGSVPTWTTPSGGGSNNWTLTGNDIYNNNSGNTGVGTTTPERKLDVNGMAQLRRSADATAGSTLENSNILQFQSAYWDGSSSVNSKWQIQSVQGVPGVASGSNLIIRQDDGVPRLSVNYDGINFYNRFGTEFMNYHTLSNRINTLSSLYSNGIYNSGAIRTNTIGGFNWSTSQILFDTYVRSITYIATGDAGSDNTAHHFSVNSAMTGTNSLLASWDNAGSPLVAITKEGKLKIGSAPSLTDKLDVYGNISIMGTDPLTSGKLLIGATASEAGPNHRLAVNGSAIFTKAVVRLIGTWPDYVFAPSYKLLPLNELETYLLKNQHLPDMPAAAEVEKNGIDLGGNQTILLKKVEELTLYLIELNKKVEILNKENEQLKKKVNSHNQ